MSLNTSLSPVTIFVINRRVGRLGVGIVGFIVLVLLTWVLLSAFGIPPFGLSAFQRIGGLDGIHAAPAFVIPVVAIVWIGLIYYRRALLRKGRRVAIEQKTPSK